ncbi:MAG: LD-carboxypeptidase, partial [Vulcanococcus sp.]
MRRRRLLQAGLALAGGSLASRSLSWAGTPAPAGLYPPALRPGSRIAALAPGTWLDPNDPWLDQLSRRCKAQGWELLRSPALQQRWRWFAGSDRQRERAW